MKKFALKLIALAALTTTLSACSTFFDKDNTPPPSPLVNFTSEAKVQSLRSTSTGSGVGDNYLKLIPTLSGNALYTASKNGTVSATSTSGRALWQVNVKHPISSGATANDDTVFVGTQDGYVIALSKTDGRQLWSIVALSEVLAPIAASSDVAVVKTVDGSITGYSTSSGNKLWHYQQTEPALTLHGSSAPRIQGGYIYAGFSNGNLAKFSLHDGNMHWQQTVSMPEGSFAIQRMVDIDADPVLRGDRIYAATYQGHIAVLDTASGREYWNHDISSYSGLATDGERVYITDATGHLWAFDAKTGAVDWRQQQLGHRILTGPAVVGNYIVVADAEGYLHWLSKQDGHFVARVHVSSAGMIATPVVDGNTVYVYTQDGRLAAYSV
jgi:outer membrane protein assembly factor BamB